ncbi:hypothetical protein [Vibrio owensii]|uniref:hypothetical protein n=1 Tax=Vibrio owensii TaxID=696485 RepID=UPI00390AA129
MSLSLIAGVASLALKLGPAAIRGVSGLFGGSDTAEKVAQAVEVADSLIGSKDQKELSISHALQQLPPESLVELEALKIELEKQETRRQEIALNDKQAEHEQTQLTIRNGDNATDEKVRQTRPDIARSSFWMMVLYVFAFEAFKAKGFGVGADIYMALTIGAPALAYFGLRTMDGFAPYSKSSGDKVTGAIKSMIKGR